jgi:hypothetical protein
MSRNASTRPTTVTGHLWKLVFPRRQWGDHVSPTPRATLVRHPWFYTVPSTPAAEFIEYIVLPNGTERHE